MVKNKSSKKTIVQSESSSDIEDKDYHVEVFYKVKAGEERGEWEYYVKWADYPEDACTWEPEDNVKDCTRLLQSFWTHVHATQKITKSKWKRDLVITPTDGWIAIEKAYFHNEFSREGEDHQEEEVIQSEKEDTRTKERKKNKREKSSAGSKSKRKTEEVSSDSDEDTPLMQLSSKAKGKRKAVSPALSDSDDEPLLSASLKRIGSRTSVHTSPSKKLRLDTQTSAKDAAVAKELFPEETRSSTAGPASSRTPLSTPVTQESESLSTALARQKTVTPRLSSQDFKRDAPLEVSGTVGSIMSTKARLGQVGTILQPASAKTLPKFIKKQSVKAASTPSLAGPREETLWNQAHQAREGQSSSTAETRSPVATSKSSPIVLPRIRPPRPADLVSKLQTPQLSPSIRKPQTPTILTSTGAVATPPTRQTDFSAQALELLSEIMPEELKTSLDSTVGETHEVEVLPPHASLISRPKAALQPQSSKIWSWSGEMYWGIKTAEARPQCRITLNEASQARLPSKLEFRWAMQESLDSITFERLYGVHDIELLLTMWAPVQQFAKVVPSDDPTPLNTLAAHMTIKNCFSCAPITDNGLVIAHIVLFSSESRYLINRFRCPTTYKSCLIMALFNLRDNLVRKEKTEMKLQDLRTPVKNILDKDGISPFAEDPRWNELAQQRPIFSRAVRVLNFPKNLYDRLSQPNRSYSVWDNMTDSHILPDTQLLLGILAETKAKRVDPSSLSRVVFIHVGALKALAHASPSVLQRTSSNPEVDFFIYGHHQSIPKRLWGLQNIFPIGGIITFTPEFLKERPLSALEIVRKIHEHELWACYVLPTVLGRAATLATSDKGQLSAFDSGSLPLRGFLQAVEDGLVAMMQSPSTPDSTREWVSAQARIFNLQTRGILEEGVKAYESFKEPIASDYRIAACLETQISRDLCNMRIEPGIIDKYRRFVVLSHSSRLSDRAKDGLEWLTLEQFSFKDNFCNAL